MKTLIVGVCLLLSACHHNGDADSKSASKVPEPGNLGILAAGVVVTAMAMRRRK